MGVHSHHPVLTPGERRDLIQQVIAARDTDLVSHSAATQIMGARMTPGERVPAALALCRSDPDDYRRRCDAAIERLK